MSDAFKGVAASCTYGYSLNSTAPFSAQQPCDILARMCATSPACRACPATSPSSLPRTYLIGRPAVCCSVGPVLAVRLSVCRCRSPKSTSTTHTNCCGHPRCHEDATRKIASVEFKLINAQNHACTPCRCCEIGYTCILGGWESNLPHF